MENKIGWQQRLYSKLQKKLKRKPAKLKIVEQPLEESESRSKKSKLEIETQQEETEKNENDKCLVDWLTAWTWKVLIVCMKQTS